MEYNIEKHSTFNVIGVRERISFAEGNEMFTTFWNKVRKGEIFKEMQALSNQKIPGMLAMMSNYSDDQTEMDIMLAFTTDETKGTDELEVFTFPEAEWLIAQVVGRPSKVMSKAWDYLLKDLIPELNYEPADLPQFEAYIADSFTSDESVNEIWVSLKKH